MMDPWDPTHHNSITLDADNRTSRVLLSATPLRDLAHHTQVTPTRGRPAQTNTLCAETPSRAGISSGVDEEITQ